MTDSNVRQALAPPATPAAAPPSRTRAPPPRPPLMPLHHASCTHRVAFRHTRHLNLFAPHLSFCTLRADMSRAVLCCDNPAAVNGRASCAGLVPAPWTCVLPVYACPDRQADNYHAAMNRPAALLVVVNVQRERIRAPAFSLDEIGATATAAAPPPPIQATIVGDISLCQYGGCPDSMATNFDPRYAFIIFIIALHASSASRPSLTPLLLFCAQRHLQRRHMQIPYSWLHRPFCYQLPSTHHFLVRVGHAAAVTTLILAARVAAAAITIAAAIAASQPLAAATTLAAALANADPSRCAAAVSASTAAAAAPATIATYSRRPPHWPPPLPPSPPPP